MFRFTYPAKLTADRKDGGYVVSFRDLPEAITQGESIEEALSEAEGALQAAIEGRIEDDMDVPAPSQSAVARTVSGKRELREIDPPEGPGQTHRQQHHAFLAL